jgi:hypothetical protein
VANFSSIIARIGLRGEADYALANEWLSRLTEEFQSSHPNCRCRAVERSVWSGVGMGQRLGRLDMRGGRHRRNGPRPDLRECAPHVKLDDEARKRILGRIEQII